MTLTEVYQRVHAHAGRRLTVDSILARNSDVFDASWVLAIPFCRVKVQPETGSTAALSQIEHPPGIPHQGQQSISLTLSIFVPSRFTLATHPASAGPVPPPFVFVAP